MSVESPEARESWLGKLQARISLVRDLGLALGVPALIGVGVWLHEAQINAAEAQAKVSEAQTKLAEAQYTALKGIFEAQTKAVEAQNAALKETQYDRALALINSQKVLFDQERAETKKQLDQERAEAKKQLDQERAEAKKQLDQERAEAKKQLEQEREEARKTWDDLVARAQDLRSRQDAITLRFREDQRLRKENEDLRKQLNSQSVGSVPPP